MEKDEHKGDRKFRKTDRLVKQSDFDRAHESDRFAADKMLVVKGFKNELTHSRLGLSISRRVGNAVVRNRWKRAVREAFRLNRSTIPAGWDLIVRPRKGATLDARRIARSLINLSRRIDSNSQRQKKRES